MPKKILFATNYSEVSAEALRVATHLARAEDALLLIVHVSERERYPVGEPCEEEPEPNPAEMKQLRSVLPTDPAVRYEHRLAYGDPGSAEITTPAKVIVELAQKENVDMIVIATHGRKGLRHLLMGDVAESVIRDAPCPVVAVRHAESSKS